MNKLELTQTIAQHTGLNRNDVHLILEEMYNCIIETLSNNGIVTLRGFGTFKNKVVPKRTFHTIHNNTLEVPQHISPVFKPSKEFVLMTPQTERSEGK